MLKGKGVFTWGAVLLALAGCNTATSNVKKLPPRPEEYTIPPDDPKYSDPIKFPDKVLYKDDPLKSQDSPLANGGRGGASSGMGGGAPSFGAGS